MCILGDTVLSHSVFFYSLCPAHSIFIIIERLGLHMHEQLHMLSAILTRVRQNKPLIHNLTNIVVANFTANGLLALGASPVMADAEEEAEDMARIADAVVLNIGTLNARTVNSMLLAGACANERGIPVILDPVGAGATRYRTETARRILAEVSVAFVRGNASEIANLAGFSWETRGVDAGSGEGEPRWIAEHAARLLKCNVIVTGAEDIVTDGVTTFLIRNGHPLLTSVTGAGCLLTSVTAAFISVAETRLLAAASALVYYGIASELAAERTAAAGPGSFQIELLNQLSRVDETLLLERAQIQMHAALSASV